MPSYRLEAWVAYREDDAEDFLEERIGDLLRTNNIRPQARPVVFRMFGTDEPVRNRK